MTKDEALRLALEVLQELEDTNSYWWQEVDEVTTKKIDPAITAIKAALEAKDELWEKFCDSNCVWTDHHPDCKLAQDEPVSWMMPNKLCDKACLYLCTNGFTQFPECAKKREWLGVTNQEIDQICGDVGYGYINVSRAIEAKLKEKNT